MTKLNEDKLNILIKLFAYNLIKDKKLLSEKINILKQIGISNKDIATILNTNENYISTAMARDKKKKNVKEKAK